MQPLATSLVGGILPFGAVWLGWDMGTWIIGGLMVYNLDELDLMIINQHS